MSSFAVIAQTLTENLAQKLCNKVFSSLAVETLKITLADNSEIPLWKQFFTYYKNRLLKYSEDETIIKMANIFEHSIQDIHKYKLFKAKLEALNSPEQFFDTELSDTSSNTNFSGINSGSLSSEATNKELKLHRFDKENTQLSQLVSRSGQSALHEDFTSVEKDWDKKDKYLETLTKSKNMLDINLSAEDINLDAIKTTVSLEESVRPQEVSPAESTGPEVSYTNIALNKATTNLHSNLASTDKSLINSKNIQTQTKNNLATNIANKNYKTIKFKYSYSEKTLRALNIYVSNFRESFFSSFSPLFIPCWDGY